MENKNIVWECPICKRPMIENTFIDRHHLIPKSRNGRHTETITLHRVCHDKIHSVWDDSELARYYHTVDRILLSESMQCFIKWVSKKPPEFYAKTKMTNSRKR